MCTARPSCCCTDGGAGKAMCCGSVDGCQHCSAWCSSSKRPEPWGAGIWQQRLLSSPRVLNFPSSLSAPVSPARTLERRGMERHSEMPGLSRQTLVEAETWKEATRRGKVDSEVLEPKDRPEERFTCMRTFIIKRRPKWMVKPSVLMLLRNRRWQRVWGRSCIGPS